MTLKTPCLWGLREEMILPTRTKFGYSLDPSELSSREIESGREAMKGKGRERVAKRKKKESGEEVKGEEKDEGKMVADCRMGNRGERLERER